MLLASPQKSIRGGKGVRKDQRIFRQRGRRRVKQRQLLLALREPLLRAL